MACFCIKTSHAHARARKAIEISYDGKASASERANALLELETFEEVVAKRRERNPHKQCSLASALTPAKQRLSGGSGHGPSSPSVSTDRSATLISAEAFSTGQRTHRVYTEDNGVSQRPTSLSLSPAPRPARAKPPQPQIEQPPKVPPRLSSNNGQRLSLGASVYTPGIGWQLTRTQAMSSLRPATSVADSMHRPYPPLRAEERFATASVLSHDSRATFGRFLSSRPPTRLSFFSDDAMLSSRAASTLDLHAQDPSHHQHASEGREMLGGDGSDNLWPHRRPSSGTLLSEFSVAITDTDSYQDRPYLAPIRGRPRSHSAGTFGQLIDRAATP